MRNISAWAIRHPVTPIVLFVVLFFLGVVAFIRLPINLDPDVSFPAVNVTVSQPGAAPSEMETQIAQKVEGSISNIGNVRNITTFIVEGQVSMFVLFEIGTPIDHLLLFCFEYNPESARYSARILKIIRLGGLLTIFTIVAGILIFRRRDLRAAKLHPPLRDGSAQGAH